MLHTLGEKIMNYQQRKEEVVQQAIEWQHNFSNEVKDYNTLFEEQLKLRNLAQRYGLIKEFKENGII